MSGATQVTTPAATRPLPERREIGRVVGREPGATLIVIGGIHGNEPGGVFAAQRVIERLGRGDVGTRGELVAFAGNLAALRAAKRYFVKDLNRVWSEDAVRAIATRPPEDDDAEDREQRELLAAIEAAIARARGPVYVADFHTTSAPGLPFVLFGDTLPQRRFATVFPLPVVIGLEEQLDGALSQYWTHRGCVTFAVEGGKHDDPASVDSLTAVLYVAIEQAGLVARDALSEVASAKALLHERRAGLPHVMEVIERHAITPEDGFVMEPGFRNLDRAREGQLLARDKRGDIRAPRDGMVILPLYQGLGNDGYFWGRAVSPMRLRASEALRRMHLDRALDWLPGVRRDRERPSRFWIDTRVARLYPLEVFHLFGYRRVRERGAEMLVERQPG
jgi:succinylglutamate desuccinylase